MAAVPMDAVAGPFAPGPRVCDRSLFAETNPVPDLAVFDFPAPVERVEVETVSASPHPANRRRWRR